jgi:hypothetical protein
MRFKDQMRIEDIAEVEFLPGISGEDNERSSSRVRTGFVQAKCRR